ncbi:MAG TPA: polyprenyl synthetase family protein [Actinomycetota bacterium]|nr:polyprenyl synthetase family protein [Actinomycetota bacterium]
MAGTAPVSREVELPAGCRELVRDVDEELARLLHRQRDRMVAVDPGVSVMIEELDRILGSGGKRLRPLFCLLGYRAGRGDPGPRIVRAAAALELLHTFAIVHDDVMDRSKVRRGEAASWMAFGEAHRREGMRGDPGFYGVAAAVLVGDLALILADQALLESGFPPARLLPALDRYNRMRGEMVAGQYLDVLAAHHGWVGEREARRVAVLKSGLYTVEGPLHIGALLAAAGQDVLTLLSRYGVALGEAFQIRDDVLGVFGDPSATGKDRDSDLREGKRTVLLARTLARVSPDEGRFIDDALGRPDLSAADVERIRLLMEGSGALASTLELIEKLTERAKSALDPTVVPPTVAETLRDMADALALRPA